MPNETAAPAQVTNLSALRKPTAPEERMPVVRAGFNDLQGFELMQRQCKALASSTLVPQQFQGNLPNCLIALEMEDGAVVQVGPSYVKAVLERLGLP